MIENQISSNDNQSNQQIRALCADLLNKTREFAKAFDFHTQPIQGAVEYWQNYRKRLATYDRNFNYPGTVNPVKCAIKGWTYLSDGTVQCIECQEIMQLSIPELQQDDFEQASLDILKGLRGRHNALCSYHAAFHHSIILHSVSDLLANIQANIAHHPFKCEEIANEFANLCHIAVIQPSFPLYFAIAGWFVKKDKTLFCKLCLQTVNPAEHANTMMDPLKLHYTYCPLLESYPQWKLALEDYVYSNSNPSSISENFALIQRQLAVTGVSSKLPTYEPLNDMDDEIRSINEGTEVGTLDHNRTLESMHESYNQNAEDSQPLRDTDFEAEIQQESMSRKRVREEIDGDSPLAKKAHLPFPHNYLEAYGQLTENVIPIIVPVILPIPVENQSDEQSMDMQYNGGLSINEQSPDLQQNEDSILSPESENDDNEINNENEAFGHEILDQDQIDRMPLHEGGERAVRDSGDEQSADDRESYSDDEATTDEERIEENAPYDEPQEFADDSRELDEMAYNSNGEPQDQSVEAESVGNVEDEEYGDYSEDEEPQPDNNDSDSDIIVLDD